MRIAIFSWESLYAIKIGGVGIHVFNLAKSLNRLGNEVHIFTRQGSKLSFNDTVEGVYIHRLPWNSGSNFFEEVRSFSNTLVYYFTEISSSIGNFDILHCHDWLTFGAGLRLKNEATLIATFHTTELGRSGSWPESDVAREISTLEKEMVSAAEQIIAISFDVKRELEQLYQTPDWKTDVGYNGIDIELTKTAMERSNTIRSELGIDSAAKIILYVGSFNLKKGTDLLINTCEKVIGSNDEAVYIFVGNGEMSGRIEGLCKEFPGRVFMISSPDTLKLQALFKESSFTVAPFRFDPFAAITLTSWASSRPVICLDRGASSEIVYNDVNGIISTEEDLINNILELLRDTEKCNWLGNNARVTVETAFSWEEVAKNTEAAYKKAVGTRA